MRVLEALDLLRVVRDLGRGELEAVSSADYDRLVIWPDDLLLTQLGERREGHAGVGTVEHACTAGAPHQPQDATSHASWHHGTPAASLPPCCDRNTACMAGRGTARPR